MESSVRATAAAAPSGRTRVRRVPERAVYDRATVGAILDAAFVSHLGFVHDGHPFVIPTLHARDGDTVLIHGSSAARSLRAAADGIEVCLTVTLLDGLVLARSVFEHSVNYRSAVILGVATPITEPTAKRAALEVLTDRLLPGRWADARQPTETELKATAVLRLPLDEASAKVRADGPEDDDTPDAELDVWAGHIPLTVTAGGPVAAPGLRPGIPMPDYVARYHRAGLTDPA